MTTLMSPDGNPITIRPIRPAEVARIPLRCWPEDPAALAQLFENQGTLGMAAWEGDKCVAQLHCYRITLPYGDNAAWPEWNHWWRPAWWAEVAREADLALNGPAWCHACCHVGRTLESFKREATESGIAKGADPRYFGRGIGTELCRASMHWAWDHDYVAVLALGAPQGLFEMAVAAGHLPWSTYTKLGFESLSLISPAGELPQWANGHGPRDLSAAPSPEKAVQHSVQDFYERLMILDLIGS
ncbi:MAG TPA: GNAT family N-acetyltransferase [Anaerolineae bacterium]|nr:GNAT family N-acetyltransferase [Anaerolineae bacterium]